MLPHKKITTCSRTKNCNVVQCLLELIGQYKAEIGDKAKFDIRFWADFHRGFFLGSKATTSQILEDLYEIIDVIDEKLLPKRKRL